MKGLFITAIMIVSSLSVNNAIAHDGLHKGRPLHYV